MEEEEGEIFEEEEVGYLDLPDEIVLEFLRFLNPRYLIHIVQFCCKRIHRLISSEFMYEKHHLKYLFINNVENIEDFEEKSSDQTWKEYTIKMFKLFRVRWIITDPNILGTDIEIPKKEAYRVGIRNPSSRYLGGNWKRGSSLFCNKVVDPRGHHEWVIRIISDRPAPCNYWLMLDQSTSHLCSQQIMHLFQLDGLGFYHQGGGFSNQRKLEVGSALTPNNYFQSPETRDIILRVTLKEWKWQVESLVQDEVKLRVSVVLINDKNVKGVYLAVPTITIQQSKEIILVSYKQKRITEKKK